jgi:MFS transporter, YQGE family, putative transporter
MFGLITKEISIFKSLPLKNRSLLLSYFLQGAATPLVGTFINAFIWRDKGDINSLIVYNLGSFISLPLGFIISGFWLKIIRINRLYFIGTILVGVNGLIIIFCSRFLNVNYIWYGLIYGLGSGFYWSARNYLTLTERNSESRNYLFSISYSLDTLTSILIPFLTGWFIVLTGKWFGFDFGGSYGVMIIVAFLLLLGSGLVILKNDFTQTVTTAVFLKKISGRWIKARTLSATLGMIEGITFFIPTLLILTNLGNEGILGSLTSVISILAALAIYIYGRNAKVRHQRPALVISILLGIIFSALFALVHNSISIILFLSANGVIVLFEWLTAFPIIANAIDREENDKNNDRFAYVADNELFLNIGRYGSVAVLCLAHLYLSWDKAIQLSPLILYGIQILLLILISGKPGRAFRHQPGTTST